MKLVIASNNAHKVTEIKDMLSGFYRDVVSLKEAGIDLDVLEDADTFEGNAMKKAVEALAVCDADAVLSDDSGLMVDALGGAPGVYSARYAGEAHDDAENRKKLLANMAGIPQEKRGAHFVTAAVLARRGKEPLVVRGTCDGLILFEERGTGGFGYDSLFYYPPFARSFAELSPAEKNTVSHRRRALEALKAVLLEEHAK